MPHNGDCVGVGIELIAGLLQGKAGILRVFPEFRWGLLTLPLLLDPVEECLVGPVHPLHDILDCLGVQLVPVLIPSEMLQLRDQFFHRVCGRIFVEHLVEPPVECDTEVPDLSGEIDARIQEPELPALIQFELICHCQGGHGSHLTGNTLYTIWKFL